MPRVRVLTDPTLFRRVFAGLIAAAVAHSAALDSITVRVARTGRTARIEVINEGHPAAQDDVRVVAPAEEGFRATGGEIGTAGPIGSVTYWMTLPLAPGGSTAAEA
jgi:signal transduction histidine kinase